MTNAQIEKKLDIVRRMKADHLNTSHCEACYESIDDVDAPMCSVLNELNTQERELSRKLRGK